MKKSIIFGIMFINACSIFISFTSCQKEKDNKDSLPPETHKGLNKIGFLFNSELFRENGKFTYGIENPDTQLSNDTLSIRAIHAGVDSKQTIAFGLAHFNGIGKYTALSYFTETFYKGGQCEYLIDSLDKSNNINITYYDPNKKIISGTFTFKIKLTFSSPVAIACDSVIEITDGRFDLVYY